MGVRFNPLTGDLMMQPATFQIRINDETFEVPYGMTWKEWVDSDFAPWCVEGLVKRFIYASDAEYFIADRANNSVITPDCFYIKLPQFQLVVKPSSSPIADMQYFSPKTTIMGEINWCDSNLGAKRSTELGYQFLEGVFVPYSHPLGKTPVPGSYPQGDINNDIATAWLSRNKIFENEYEVQFFDSYGIPNANQWGDLLNGLKTVCPDYLEVEKGGNKIILPYGLYMVSEVEGYAIQIHERIRGWSDMYIPVTSDVPRYVRPIKLS